MTTYVNDVLLITNKIDLWDDSDERYHNSTFVAVVHQSQVSLIIATRNVHYCLYQYCYCYCGL